MALLSDIFKASSTPYNRPPAVKVKVVAEREMRKVLKWTFTEGDCVAAVTKSNKMCAISDGVSVTKVTLFEELADKLKVGNTYIIKNALLKPLEGRVVLNIGRDTNVFRTAPLDTPACHVEEGQLLLSPPSPLRDLTTKLQGQLMTLEGLVIEVSSVTKITRGQEEYPLKRVTLSKDGEKVPVCLWREATLQPIEVGKMLRVSHVRGTANKFGFSAQSTGFTVVEIITPPPATMEEVEGIELGDPVVVLLVGGTHKEVSQKLWEGVMGIEFPEFPLFLTFVMEGKNVIGLEKMGRKNSEE